MERPAHVIADPSREAESRSMTFVGSWRTTFFEADGPPTLGLATFGADGTLLTAEHPVVTPPMAPGPIFTSAGHGAWTATGAATAVATLVGLGSTGEGSLFAVVTVRASITLSDGGHLFTGDIVWTITDPQRKVLATYPGTWRGSRILAANRTESTI